MTVWPHLYEARTRNMGNSGRHGGEDYTPRPLIRAMVRVVQPRSLTCIISGIFLA